MRENDAAVAGGSKTSRVELIERLWQAAEAQVRAHETRLKGLAVQEAAAEPQAKALATLARTLKELIDLDAAARAASEEDDPHDADPDGAMADLDSLRTELARRLDGLVGGSAPVGPGGA
jgi:hypothetical protein